VHGVEEPPVDIVTELTPRLSVAVPVTVTVPDTVAPVAGELMVTAGAVVSGLFRVTFTELEPLLFAASFAVTVIVKFPFADDPECHVQE